MSKHVAVYIIYGDIVVILNRALISCNKERREVTFILMYSQTSVHERMGS